jgi:hypothetical protein
MGFVVAKVVLRQVLSEFFGFPVNIIPPSFSILIYHLGDQQYVRQWQQFRDVISPHTILKSTELLSQRGDHQLHRQVYILL